MENLHYGTPWYTDDKDEVLASSSDFAENCVSTYTRVYTYILYIYTHLYVPHNVATTFVKSF